MSEKEPGSNRGRKSMGLRTVEVGIPVEQYELLERYAGKGGISNAIRSAVRGLLNAVDDEMFADVFPLRWVEGAERCGVLLVEPAAASAVIERKPAAKPSGRGVDADRVIACLRERKRSARDVANALKMDLATAGEVMGALIRDGVVRQRRDKVMELVG